MSRLLYRSSQKVFCLRAISFFHVVLLVQVISPRCKKSRPTQIAALVALCISRSTCQLAKHRSSVLNVL
jgi:hypothetical protein